MAADIDIVERLRDRADNVISQDNARLFEDAADTITALRSRIEELERERDEASEALEPFAEGAKRIDQYYGDSTGWQEQMPDDTDIDTIVIGDELTVCQLGDLRRARSVYTAIRALGKERT